MTEDTKTIADELEAVKRKNAELLGEVKGLKAKVATLEQERDAATGRAEEAHTTMDRVLLEEPLERAIAQRFVVPWRVVRPMVAEHFDFALNDEGKPVATTKGDKPEALDLPGALEAMAMIPDLAATMRKPMGDGSTGNGSGRSRPAQPEKPAPVPAPPVWPAVMTAACRPRRGLGSPVPAQARRYPLAPGGAALAALAARAQGRERGRACRALWASVLHVALEDEVKNWKRWWEWMEQPDKPGPLMPRPERWVGSGDFYLVCALAGFDGDLVLERWKQTGGKGFALPAQKSRAIVGQKG